MNTVNVSQIAAALATMHTTAALYFKSMNAGENTGTNNSATLQTILKPVMIFAIYFFLYFGALKSIRSIREHD